MLSSRQPARASMREMLPALFPSDPIVISNNYASLAPPCANQVHQKIRTSNKQMHVIKATHSE
jgi:hypothetical protein